MRRLLYALLAATTLAVAFTTQAGAIVGGQPETVTRPWMGSLQSTSGSHGCGTSLIKPGWAVTAYHCVESWKDDPAKIANIQVRFNSNDYRRGGTVVKVAGVEIPPGAKIQGADIALLKLAAPVNLPTIPIATTSPAVGSNVKLIGWGLTCGQSLPPLYYCNNSQPPDAIQGVTMAVAPDWQCTGIPPVGIVADNDLCLGGFLTDKGSCYGDSGGPAIADGVLAGVTSRGPHVWLYGSCKLGPVVYTDVSAFSAWIRSVTG